MTERPIGVIGAGTIGAGLAICALLAGYSVIMVDSNQDALEKADQAIFNHFIRLVSKGKIDARIADAANRNFTRIVVPREDFLVPLGACDFVIEAVFDHPEVKHGVYRNIARVATNPAMVIMSTTSALPAEVLNGYGGHVPVVVAHPFWPSWRQRSVEIAHIAAHADAAARASTFMASIGKVPLPCADVWGFAGNRVFCQYGDAARTVGISMGLSIAEVDFVTRHQFGGGGIFTALDGTGSGTPKGTRLAVEVLQGMAANLPNGAWLTPHEAFASQHELWLPDGCPEGTTVDITKTLLFERAMLANLLAVTLGLLHEGVMAAGDLDFLTKDALGFKNGLIAWMQKLGRTDVWEYLQCSHRSAPMPPNEAWARVEEVDLPAYYRSLAERGIT